MTRYTLEEQETILRYDRASDDLHVYTASPPEAAKWKRLGYPLKELSPHSWVAIVPKACLRPLRRLVGGQVPKRRATGRGFIRGQTQAVQPGSEQQSPRAPALDIPERKRTTIDPSEGV